MEALYHFFKRISFNIFNLQALAVVCTPQDDGSPKIVMKQLFELILLGHITLGIAVKFAAVG